ncbi:hypothetical protein, partial [Jutongia sp.]|uniref:hypothetical protein n=1 Tax=Jutongia sp. TaxID=2944204 RepID=UPI003078CC15
MFCEAKSEPSGEERISPPCFAQKKYVLISQAGLTLISNTLFYGIIYFNDLQKNEQQNWIYASLLLVQRLLYLLFLKKSNRNFLAFRLSASLTFSYVQYMVLIPNNASFLFVLLPTY